MDPALVVDGHGAAEQGEGALAVQLFRRSQLFSRVVYRRGVLPAQDLVRSWGAVWIVCHTTIYQRANRGSLELREGGAFRRFATADTIKQLRAQLLVLSTCNSYGGPFAGTYASQWVVSHRDRLIVEDGLVFAARFLYRLSTTTRSRLDYEYVRNAYRDARRSAGDRNWRFTSHAST